MIIPLHAANPGPLTGSGNWTYLITGSTPVLVDAGVGKPEHLDAIAAHVPNGPAHVFVTHGHSDHIAGAPALAARWPNARFWKFLWPSFDRQYEVVWNPLADELQLEAGDGSLRVIHTPGHAPDHVSFWHAPSRTLFSGDLVVLGSTVVIPASAGGRLDAYLQSLKRVLALGPSTLLPAHGPVIENPNALIEGYLKHRQDRERQVVAALEAGVRRVDDIADRIYAGLDAALVPMARESVLAHLQKLETDGRVRRDDESWELY